MSKVITFSRSFPAYHPKAGQPTYFVEQFHRGLSYDQILLWNPKKSIAEQMILALDIWRTLGRKYHTIRAGKRWKVGDTFSPRVWSGKPYRSKMIIIAPDITIEKVWDFEMDLNGIFSLLRTLLK